MDRIFRAEEGYIACYITDDKEKRRKIYIKGKNLDSLRKWVETGEVDDYVQKLTDLNVLSYAAEMPNSESCMELNKGLDAELYKESNTEPNTELHTESNTELNTELSNILSGPEKLYFKRLLDECRSVRSPQRSMQAPESMNIELTAYCPLKCPQCYCELNAGKHIDKNVAIKYIKEAAKLKIPSISMSGGETLTYPYLTDLIKTSRFYGLSSAIAISGWGFTAEKLDELKRAGINEIYVSLNGSTEEINSRSRDGYREAVNALKILKQSDFKDYYINWVARNDNIDDFRRLVELARGYGVKSVIILALKPDAKYEIKDLPSKEKFYKLLRFLKEFGKQNGPGWKESLGGKIDSGGKINSENMGNAEVIENRESTGNMDNADKGDMETAKIEIEVEPCYSPLRALLYKRYFANFNTGIDKGCRAGRSTVSVNVNGELCPCRHLPYPEKFGSIEEYWRKSKILEKLRSTEDNREEPCAGCSLSSNCLSCRAPGAKIFDNVHAGDPFCPVI